MYWSTSYFDLQIFVLCSKGTQLHVDIHSSEIEMPLFFGFTTEFCQFLKLEMAALGVGSINSASHSSTYESLRNSRNATQQAATKVPCTLSLSHYKPRIFRSKRALIVLFWHFMINLAFQATNYQFDAFSEWAAKRNMAFHGLVHAGIFLFSTVLCPMYGFLADVYFGRHKVLQVSSILFIIGMIFGEIHIILKAWNIYSNEIIVSLVLDLPCIILTLLCFISAKSIMFTFGMDQIKNPSSDELSSYIFWWVFVEVLSLAIGSVIFISPTRYFDHGLIVFTFTNAAVGFFIVLFLIINKCHFAPLYFDEQAGADSYRQVTEVVRFAALNKYPLNRSAWTYCEDEKITRLDLAKIRYGGPFTTEQVENVKTIIRLLLILGACCASSFGFLAASNLNIIDLFLQHMQWNSVALKLSLFYCPDVVVLVLIPVFETLLYPCVRRWLPSILKRLGLTIILSLMATASFIAIGDLIDSSRATCMFQDISNSSLNESAFIQSDEKGYMLLIPLVINNIAFVLFRCTTLELIVAQSPSSFKIILIGLLYTMKGIRDFAFEMLILIFKVAHHSLPESLLSCGTIFYLTALTIGICGLVLYCISAKKYTYRRRDDITVNEHMYAEEYFSQNSP